MFGPQKIISKKPNNMTFRQKNKPTAAQNTLTATRLQQVDMIWGRQIGQLEKTKKRQIVSQNVIKQKPNIQTNILPRQSGINRYITKGPSNSNVKFQSLNSGMGLAPTTQYVRYLDDGGNVFYEDSSNMKNLRIIKIAKIYLLSILFILIGLYFLIGRIRPYPMGQCPIHADCQVFIHCHRGYVNVDDRCEIDPNIINQAHEIGYAVIEQLSLELGDNECLSEPLHSFSIYKKITDVFMQFQIEDDLLKDQIANYFQKRQYQKQKKFTYIINMIVPNVKKYSFVCRMQLFYMTPAFKYILLSFLCFMVIVIYLVRSYLQQKKAKQIYDALKKYTLENGHIQIDAYKTMIESLYGKWDQSTWILVDEMRFQDLRIVYYIEQYRLYWKKIS